MKAVRQNGRSTLGLFTIFTAKASYIGQQEPCSSANTRVSSTHDVSPSYGPTAICSQTDAVEDLPCGASTCMSWSDDVISLQV